MSIRTIATIAVAALVMTAAAVGTVWAVVGGAVPTSSEQSADSAAQSSTDAGPPFFHADELDRFFLDEATVARIAGQPLALRTGGTEFRAVALNGSAGGCSAVLGLVDPSPAGAREQFDRSRDEYDFIFYQSVYQFAPPDAAVARFEEIAESFATCGRFDLGNSSYADVTDHSRASGVVSALSADVTMVYGMDGESFVTVATHAANVISVSFVFQRYGSEIPLPADARTQLIAAMTDRATTALEEWRPRESVVDARPIAEAGASEAAPPERAPQFIDINGTWCYWADSSSCFTIDLPNIGDSTVVSPPQAGAYYAPSGDGYTYVVPGEECFTASAVPADGDEFGGAVLYYCPRGVSSSEVGSGYNFNNDNFDRVYISQEGPRDPSFRREDWAAAVGQ